MANVKEAVTAASEFVADMYPDAKAIRLEGVEGRGDLQWKVTISFVLDEPSPFAAALGAKSRVFKEVDVDRSTGEPQALRIWQP